MRTRAFGGTDLKVSEFGLGCARIGGIFQQGAQGFLDLLSEAHASGITFFDTADMYSQGESETLIGRAFRKKRHEIVIASKAGYCLPAQRKLIARVKPFVRPVIRLLRIRRDRLPAAVRGSLAQDFSPRYLERAVEGSLRRLRTDYLDLLQLHSPPAEIVERGEWVSALERLKRSGKVRHYGVSCDTVEAGLAALRYPGVASLQIVVNMLEPRFGDALLAKAHAKRVGVIARECLANGLLVKSESEIDLSKYCQSPEEQSLRRDQLSKFRAEASARGISLTTLGLESVTRSEGVSVTLVGARTVEQLRGVLRALPS